MSIWTRIPILHAVRIFLSCMMNQRSEVLLSFFCSTSGYPRLWITDSIVAFSLHPLPWIQEFWSKNRRKEASHVDACYFNYLSSISRPWWMSLNLSTGRMEIIWERIRWLSIEPCASYMYILGLYNLFSFSYMCVSAFESEIKQF